MVRHRIFIAINLPKEIKEKLLNYQNYWPEVPAKWTKPENLDISGLCQRRRNPKNFGDCQRNCPEI